jgi:hypothetical protein
MAYPPPFQVPSLIVSCYPELLIDSDKASIVTGILNDANGLDQFRSVIEQQGPPTPESGWASEVTVGTATRLDLSDATLAALPPLVSQVLNLVMQTDSLKGDCWTVQNGIVPGNEPVVPNTGNWTLPAIEPQNGLEFTALQYTADQRTLSVTIANRRPRHVGVYAQFLNSGAPVVPIGWTSRLPVGVPAGYESDSVKFLSCLAPNTPVGGVAVNTSPQALSVSLPDNADSVRLLFGGLGNGSWNSIVDTAGTILTVVLDYAVPVIAAEANATPSSQWLTSLLTDASIATEILAAGAFLLSDSTITDVPSALARLSTTTTTMLLNDLPTLRQKLETKFGQTAVTDAAPYVGWPASTLRSLVMAQSPTSNELFATSSLLLGTPATFDLALSPATTIALDVVLQPVGGWPFEVVGYSVSIAYSNGYSQQQTGAVSPATVRSDLTVSFGCVRNNGPIRIAAALYDAHQNVMAEGSTVGSHQGAVSNRIVTVPVSMTTEAVKVTSQTRFVHAATLTCDGNQYAWSTRQPHPTDLPRLGTAAGVPAVTRWIQLTIEQSSQSLGYVWAATNQGLQSCDLGTPLQTAYVMQNIGAFNPAAGLKTISCGFARSPGLIYDTLSSAANGYFVDPRGPNPCLRAVSFSAGPFDLTPSASCGRFRESSFSDFALHPGRFAAAISWENSWLEVVRLSASPQPDAQSPVAQILSGPGHRAGLMLNPIAIDVTPAGTLLVLEQGNARVQCLDVHGNPVPCFGGTPFMTLQPAPSVNYLDLAVSPAGVIYILSTQNGGQTPADYLLDAYAADGSHMSRTTGINAARIAVGLGEVIYSLNYGTITGSAGHLEPTLSVWLPSTDGGPA